MGSRDLRQPCGTPRARVSAAPMTAFGKFVRCHRHRVNLSRKDEKIHDRHATNLRVYARIYYCNSTILRTALTRAWSGPNSELRGCTNIDNLPLSKNIETPTRASDHLSVSLFQDLYIKYQKTNAWRTHDMACKFMWCLRKKWVRSELHK